MCGAQMCQKNNPGTYQVRKLAESLLLPLLRAPCHRNPHIYLPTTIGAGSGPRRPAVDGDHWQGLASSVSSARDVCITPGTRVRGQGYPVTPNPYARFFSPTFTSLDEGDYGLDRGHRRQEGDAWEASLNEIFWHRQQGLLQVLKAYTLYRPEQGYCQAQGPVAAVLLMHLPPEVSDPALRPSIPSDLKPSSPNPRY